MYQSTSSQCSCCLCRSPPNIWFSKLSVETILDKGDIGYNSDVEEFTTLGGRWVLVKDAPLLQIARTPRI